MHSRFNNHPKFMCFAQNASQQHLIDECTKVSPDLSITTNSRNTICNAKTGCGNALVTLALHIYLFL